MSYTLKEIAVPDERELSAIAALWSESFGDGLDFVYSFYKRMPVHSTICFLDSDIPVSMAVLLDVSGSGRAYYGYAVCTDKDHRGKGLCKGIHDYIKEKCARENSSYFVHPADESLSYFYKKLGMEDVSSYYEVSTLSLERGDTYGLTPSEYMRIRDLYFGGFNYYPWSENALSFMTDECGISFVGAFIDGCECAAALDGTHILELCAPDHLCGRAVSALLPEKGKMGTVRFISEPNHTDRTGIMSFGSQVGYFNLFIE